MSPRTRYIGGAVQTRGGRYAEVVQGREIVACVSPPGGLTQVHIYTSLASGESAVRDCGEDAVRVVVGYASDNGFRPLMESRKLLRTAPQGPEEGRIGVFLGRLRDAVRAAYALALQIPRCPRCEGPMAQRAGSRGAFWGCLGYPACRGTREVKS